MPIRGIGSRGGQVIAEKEAKMAKQERARGPVSTTPDPADGPQTMP
jgi:hypothetical protein